MKKYINIWTILILLLTVAGIVLACIEGFYGFITWVLWAGVATFFLYLAGVEKEEMVSDYKDRIQKLTEERNIYFEKYDRQLGQFDEVQHQLDQVKHEFFVYKKEHPDVAPQEEAVKVTVTASQKKKSKKKTNE